MTTDDPIAALAALLEQEFTALRQADFADLDEIATDKEALLGALAAAPAPTAAALDALIVQANRNAACLQAASRGIRAARRRLAELRRAAEGLSTYDRNGRRNDAPAGRGRVEHRA